MVARGKGDREVGDKDEGEYSQQYCDKFAWQMVARISRVTTL